MRKAWLTLALTVQPGSLGKSETSHHYIAFDIFLMVFSSTSPCSISMSDGYSSSVPRSPVGLYSCVP